MRIRAIPDFTFIPRFPGQYYDRETGLHYNYFRDYDPTTGRYVQSDLIGLEGGINTYGYVGGNPVLFFDNDGLQIASGAGAAAGAGAGLAGGLAGGAGAGGRSSSNDYDYFDDGSRSRDPDDARSRESSDSRSIPKPQKPKCGCTCNCRADGDDRIPGNVKPGKPKFAFGTATANNCAAATKEAKRSATQSLGMQPKHVGCRCEGK